MRMVTDGNLERTAYAEEEGFAEEEDIGTLMGVGIRDQGLGNGRMAWSPLNCESQMTWDGDG